MTGNLSGFNANEVEPQSFDVLPEGEYEACITSSEIKATKAGDGKYLNLELDILAGPHRGRKVFDLLNLWNPNPKAVEIAKGTLSAICRAVGVLTPNDSSELYGKPLTIKLGIERSDQYGDKNKVKAYKASKPLLGGGAAAAEELPPRGEPAPNDEIPF